MVGWRESELTSARMDFLRLTLRSCRPDDMLARGAASDDSLASAWGQGVDRMWAAGAESGKVVGN